MISNVKVENIIYLYVEGMHDKLIIFLLLYIILALHPIICSLSREHWLLSLMILRILRVSALDGIWTHLLNLKKLALPFKGFWQKQSLKGEVFSLQEPFTLQLGELK